jgi:hypothetical protein
LSRPLPLTTPHALLLQKVEADVAVSQGDNDELEKNVIIKQKTLEMLPNAQSHIDQLQQICNASAQKLIQLGGPVYLSFLWSVR